MTTKSKNLILLIVIILGLSLYKTISDGQGNLIPLQDINATTRQIEPLELNIDLYSLDDKTIFTGYSLSVDETDENPCIGAGNNNLCELRPALKNDNVKICASRDLPLDTIVYIDGIGECIIKDRLNARYKGTNRIDVLMDSKQEARNFGVKILQYIIL